MLHLLETGRALYVLAAICLLGIITRAFARHLYKRLWKESSNLAMTKNKSLKELRQRAENTYRMNQGMRDSGAWLEHQLYDLKTLGISLNGWSNLAVQWTWLCLLAGGAGAFFSYWYRLDTLYIVMYGGGAVMMAMLTMLFDNGINGGWRDRLVASLKDYLENVMCPRLARNLPLDGMRGGNRLEVRADGNRDFSDRMGRFGRGGRSEQAGGAVGNSTCEQGRNASGSGSYEPEGSEAGDGGIGAAASGAAATAVSKNGNVASISSGGGRKTQTRGGRRQSLTGSQPSENSLPDSGEPQEGHRDIDYLKKSLEQIAASREKSRVADENWLKDLKPEEVELIGDILKQYLA